MARIVNLGMLAPEDFDFRTTDGRSFIVSGSIGMDAMLRLARLEQVMMERRDEADAAEKANDVDTFKRASDEALGALEDLSGEILDVLRVHQPDLEEMPFSQHETGVFLATLRGALDEQAGVPPTSPPSTTPTGTTPNRAARRASTRSSGSRASSKPSGSSRTTGGA